MTLIPLHIRPSDCDSLDHVNNAAYVDLVHYAVARRLSQLGFTADWTEYGPCRWTMQDLAIEYRLASSFSDSLMASVWLAEPDPIEPGLGCEITRSDADAADEPGQTVGENAQQVVVRSRAHWQRRDKITDKPVPLPDSLLEALAIEAGDLPRPLKRPTTGQEVRCYRWQHRVERAEVGLEARANPHILFEWIEESILSASAKAGWPIERCLAADFVVFQMRHDARFLTPPVLGDSIEIVSRLVDVRRLRGTWHNEIRSRADGQLLIENFSTGVFLNLSGRPTSPPAGMIEALQTPVG